MAALARLLTTGKVDPEKLERAGLGELPATAGLTWAQLLKRPEVTIEPLLAALRDDLARDPLLAEFITNSKEHQAVDVLKGTTSVVPKKPARRRALAPEGRSQTATHPSSAAPAATRHAPSKPNSNSPATWSSKRSPSQSSKPPRPSPSPAGSSTAPSAASRARCARRWSASVPLPSARPAAFPASRPPRSRLVHVSIRLQGNKRRATA